MPLMITGCIVAIINFLNNFTNLTALSFRIKHNIIDDWWRGQLVIKTDAIPTVINSYVENVGINGSWVQDFDFARDYGQYSTPWVYPLGPYGKRTAGAFVPSEDAPFPWPTSWKWVDNECSVDIMTYEGICHVLKRHNIRHILFYGDSLTNSHYTSFVNMLSSKHFEETGTFKKGNNGVLTCPLQNDDVPFSIQIMHQRDRGGNAFPNSPRDIYGLENETQKFFQDAREDRLLGVFNIGAHYHNWTHYTEDMDTMIGLLSEVNRSQDLYFFRSTSPGHKNCITYGRNFDWKRGTRLRPLTNYSEYESGTRYDWNKFDEYNNYTKHLLLQRKLMGLQPLIHYFNIWNMTALRSDAHTDCLHFTSPGPVDWWNHLLYTYLKRMLVHDTDPRSPTIFV